MSNSFTTAPEASKKTAFVYAPISALLGKTRIHAIATDAAAGFCLFAASIIIIGMVSALFAYYPEGTAHHENLKTIRFFLFSFIFASAIATGLRFILVPAYRLSNDRKTAAFLEHKLPESAGIADAVQFNSESGAELPYSSELAYAHVERIAANAGHMDIRPAISMKPVRKSSAFLGFAIILHLALLPFLSDAFMKGYGSLLGRKDIIAELDAAIPVPEIITGDIELVFHYPAYTGLPSRSISGTSGHISALKGTEVEISTRADRDLASASIVMQDTVIALDVEDSRLLHGRILVLEPGSYHFRFHDSRRRIIAEGSPHRISPKPDEYPEITVSTPGYETEEIEIREQERISLEYRAEDDFAISEIALVYRIRGGNPHRKLIRRADTNRVEGRWVWDIGTLRLSPGDRIAWHLEALDNDTVSGPKKSTTGTRYLKVFSAVEFHRELMEKVEAHWETMIDRLGDHLEEPFSIPESIDGRGDIEETVTARRHVEKMNTLLMEIRSTVEELREDSLSPAALVDALDNIESGLAEANRDFDQSISLFDSHSRIRRQADAARGRIIVQIQERIIRKLEGGIIYLEKLLDKQKLQDLIAMAQEIREHQRRLADLVESLRDNPDEETRSAISEEMERIRERILELMARMSDLAEGIRDEHLNLEAMEQLGEQKDLLGNLDEIQRRLEEGELDDALTMLMEMSAQIDSLLDDWREKDDGFGGEMYAELQREVMEFMDDLHRIKRDQENLLESSLDFRDSYRERIEERLDELIDDMIDNLIEIAKEGRSELEKIPDQVFERGFGHFDRETVESAIYRFSDIITLLKAGDYDEALKMAQDAYRHSSTAAGSFSEQLRHARRHPRFTGNRAEELADAAEKTKDATGYAREIVDELKQLFPEPEDIFSPCEQAGMKESAAAQRELSRRTAELQRQLHSIGEQAPVFSPQMDSGIQEASQHMQGAERHLDQYDPRQAGSRQRAAVEKLNEIQQMMEDSFDRDGQGSMPLPIPRGGPGRSGRGPGSGRMSQEKVEIPGADQYEAPEQFRRDLLEAMREGTPERYREQVRRYYEELVR